MMPWRYLICILGTSGVMATSIVNHSFLVALQEMVFPFYEVEPFDVEVGHCHPKTVQFRQMNLPPEYAKFYWEKDLVRAISQSYHIGYLVSLLPAGLLADMYGAQHVWEAGLLLACIMTLLLPSLTLLGPYVLIVGLILLGFGQGACIACGGTVTAHWAKEYELCTFSGTIHIGELFGWFFVSTVSPYITKRFGWQVLLYIGGLVEVVCCVAWYALYRNNPRHEYIPLPSAHSQLSRNMFIIGQPLPWKHIFLSSPVLSLCLLSLLSGWTLYTLLSILNDYLYSVINIPAREGQMVARFSFITTVLSALLHAIACDWLVAKGFMSRTFSRRSFSVLPNFLMIPFLLSVTLWDCNTYAVALTILTIFYLRGVSLSTLHANSIDLSPRHVGVLTALTQICVTIGAMINKEFHHYITSPKV